MSVNSSRIFFQLENILRRLDEEITTLKGKVAQLELRNTKPGDEDGDKEYEANEGEDKTEKDEEMNSSSPVSWVRGEVNGRFDCVL